MYCPNFSSCEPAGFLAYEIPHRFSLIPGGRRGDPGSNSKLAMSLSPVPDASPEDSGSHLQPFFVLHRASPQKPHTNALGSRKARRKIDLVSSPHDSQEETQPNSLDDEHFEKLRLEAFHLTWSNIESTIKDVLRQINFNLYNEVHKWVQESFLTIKSSRTIASTEIQRPYPLVAETVCRRIPTALLLTKNVEFVDDVLTFQELGDHLRSNGCHVANLSALDFTVKHGIGGCLRTLFRHLITEGPDVADVAVLASWYCEQENYERPVVMIIDDMEQCDGSVLSDFITMLSEWVVKVPIAFIMGVSTTIDAPRSLLKSDALQHIQPFKFTMEAPYDRMNAITEAVLIKPCFGFTIGHKVAGFLNNYFLRHDGTITSFVRALKLACVKHFMMEPLSFLSQGMLCEDSEEFWHSKCKLLPDFVFGHVFDLPSCSRLKVLGENGDFLARGLSQLRRLQEGWSSSVMFLFELSKHNKVQLLDIVCEVLDPAFCGPSDRTLLKPSLTCKSSSEEIFGFKEGGFVAHAIDKVRELPLKSLSHWLNNLSLHTEEMTEVRQIAKELHSIIESASSGKILKDNLTDTKLKVHNVGRIPLSVNDRIFTMMVSIIRKLLTPIECIPFHEIVCFRHADLLRTALVGDPRRTIQVDLVKSQRHLQCSCCSRGKNGLLPSMHDTSILYNLAQEYGDLLNLHDCYQSFKATLFTSTAKAKHKGHSPASKKVKAVPQVNEATIQARFCRAVTELQITGLLRMPSKRRPDFVQRVAFGLW